MSSKKKPDKYFDSLLINDTVDKWEAPINSDFHVWTFYKTNQFPLMHSYKYIMLGAEMLIIYNLLEQ